MNDQVMKVKALPANASSSMKEMTWKMDAARYEQGMRVKALTANASASMKAIGKLEPFTFPWHNAMNALYSEVKEMRSIGNRVCLSDSESE